MTEICVALSIICLSCITERAESYTRISEASISLDKFWNANFGKYKNERDLFRIERVNYWYIGL